MDNMIPEIVEDYVYHREPGIILLKGSCLDILPLLDAETIQCCVTSPPYWGLRDYGSEDQLGLEDSPEAYTGIMANVFDGVKRVLRSDGTLWLNLGDSYASSWSSGRISKIGNGSRDNRINRLAGTNLKEKDLVGIPWKTAFALQSSGWYLRSDIIEEVEFYCPCGCGHVMEERIVRYSQDREIIWSKSNPMPESVTDRPTKAHEYMFLMSKSQKYYYDHEAIKERATTRDERPRDRETTKLNNTPGRARMAGLTHNMYDMRNKRSVWNVATKPFKGAHFAVFPPELIEPCILAGTKEGDIVIDPFSGSGTTGMVCKKHKRRYIGIELNEEYLKLSPDRIGAQEVLF